VSGPASPAASQHTPLAVVVLPPDFEALPGSRAHFGVLDGAAYRVEVPGDWNGGLLLWAKGFRSFGPEVAAEGPPLGLRELLISQGYAWAATSYSEAGWVPGAGTEDTLALKRWFEQYIGEPDLTFIGGDSMGGNIVVLSLENHPNEYDGGLSICGVVAGGGWMDYLLAWGTAAEFIAGAHLPIEQGSDAVEEALRSQVFPALGPPDNPTSRGNAFASVIRNLTGGPRPFFEKGFQNAYPKNFGLATGDPGRVLPATRAGGTEGIDFRADQGLGFDGEAINNGIRRLPADPNFRDPARHPDVAPTTGRIEDPLLTLHETGDLTVPVSMEQEYRRKADALGRGDLLVQRLIRGGGHCEFSAEEVASAWDALAGWVEGGNRPQGDEVLGDLSNAGLTFTNPLRPDDPFLR
jgi:acetyl esterase/lipase